MTNRGKNLLIRKCNVTRTKKDVHASNEMHPKSIFNFHLQKQSIRFSYQLFILFPLTYNTTATLDKLTCTNYVDSGICQDRFGQFFWSKSGSIYLDVKLKVIKKDDNKQFSLVQNLTVKETDLNQCMRLKNQLVIEV